MTITKAELEKKNKLYLKYVDDWMQFGLVYESGRSLIDEIITRHPRESAMNYETRKREAYVVNFAQAIVDVLSFYVSEKETTRSIPVLEDNELWDQFKEDADLRGTDYDELINDNAKLASIQGAVGMLVNMPGGNTMTIKDNIENGIYPYISTYTLPNIYDWAFQRNPVTHRYELVYLKLYEGDGKYLIWRLDYWSIYQIKMTPQGTESGIVEVVGQGKNTLGEIPFVWMVNINKPNTYPLGESDIKDVSRIVTSIVQNCSSMEEVLKMAGFPMLREPMAKDDESEPTSPVGPRRTFEFDPTLGKDGKPDWMPTEILEPVDAHLKVIMWKVDEIYRIMHLSGMKGQRTSNGAQSGLALRYEFAQLNTMLNKKTTNIVEADFQIVSYWLKWMEIDPRGADIKINRSREFNIDEMSIVLDNVITGMRSVLSKKYRIKAQEKMVKIINPDLSPEDVKDIFSEIEKNTPEAPDLIQWVQDLQNANDDSVRNGLQSRAVHDQ